MYLCLRVSMAADILTHAIVCVPAGAGEHCMECTPDGTQRAQSAAGAAGAARGQCVACATAGKLGQQFLTYNAL